MIIEKYILPEGHGLNVRHQIPQDSETLYIGVQDGKGFIWIRLWSRNPLVSWKFTSYGTGIEHMPEGGYAGTYSDSGGYVWHIYCENAEPKTRYTNNDGVIIELTK